MSQCPPDLNKCLELRSLTKQIDKLLSDQKKKHFQFKFEHSKNDPKKLWRNINEIVPTSNKNSPFPIDEISNDLVINFNYEFTTSGGKIYDEIIKICPNRPEFLNGTTNFPQFQLNTIGIQDTLRVIHGLKNTSSLTADGLSLYFIKESLDILALTITQLINMSIVNQKMPKIWKKSYITPVHKKGGLELDKFRPISIEPNFGKSTEAVVASQLVKHCERHKIFNPHKYGYRKSANTGMALANITETIFLNLDNHNICLLVLLDLSKAFDSIPHNLLLDVLKYYNLYIPWFEDYLSDRTQCTKIESIISEPLPVQFGVPQGSVLGPILFILYINEIKEFASRYSNNNIEFKIITYADDTQLLFSCHPDHFDELRDFASIVTTDLVFWFYSLKLKTNISKNQCILFATKTQLCRIPEEKKNVIINGHKTVFSQSVKTLGVHLDYDMKFKSHLNKIYKSVFNKLYFMNKCRNSLNFYSRKLLVEYCALSHLNYCREIWGNFSREQHDMIHKLLSFGAKIIFLRSKYDHSSHLIESLEFLSNEKTNTYFLSCTAFKCINNLHNQNIPKIFNLNVSLSKTRNKIILPRARTSYMHLTILYKSSKIWIQLPDELKNKNTFQSFKKSLKLMLKGDEICINI